MTKTNPNHPLYIEMISTAISNLKERKGSSRQAVIKYIKANYTVGDNAGQCIKMTLKRNVLSGKIVQTSGTGASGSFKLAAAASKKNTESVSKKPASKRTKPTKKPKAKSPVKKNTTPKTPTKKSPKKPASKASARKKVSRKSPPKKGKR